MANMARLRVALSGAAVTGPGVSTFYIRGSVGSLLAASLYNFYNSCKGNMPSSLTITMPTGGELIDDATGALTGVWTGGPGTSLVGSDPGGYAKGVGGRVVWETAGITGGRRVRGSTFMIPLGAGAYDTAGTLASILISNWQTAANLVISGNPDFCVWSKPAAGRPGKSSVVTAATIPDLVSTLRSRRS